MPSNILEGRIKKKVKRNASLRKCVCFLFDFLVVANKTWCFFSLCVVCCLNIWMYFTAVRICQRYHITWFLSFVYFRFLFVPELWPILFWKLQIHSELDIMLIFIFLLLIILLFLFEFTVKYEIAVCLMHLFILSLCTCPSVHLSDCCWWINYVPVMWS